MGCDIHSVVQVKKNGKWKTVLQDVAGDDRSYDTFAILANVRNGYGFAGIDTGDGYIPISAPRGLPDDFEIDGIREYHPISKNTPSGDTLEWADEQYRNAKLKQMAEDTEVWMGEHSYSYHTLAQLQNYMQQFENKKTRKRGYISEKEYLALRGTNKSPDEWSGSISGRDIKTMTQSQYEILSETDNLPKDKNIHVQYEWVVGYTEHTYIDKIIEELKVLAKRYEVTPQDVRMVFGFDS